MSNNNRNPPRPNLGPRPPTPPPNLPAQPLPGIQRINIEGLRTGPNAGNKVKLEPGQTVVNTESGKQYTIIALGRGDVQIQSTLDTEVKFRLAIDKFLQKYKVVDPDEAAGLFRPDPSRFTFDKMIMWADAVESIDVGVRRILDRAKLEEIWNISKLEAEPRSILNFYGEPGTGKTMAAKCISTKLNKPMLQADYAKMISKYVGDTGKHIKAAFEMAKKHNAILFLDEADALVSTRLSMNADRHSVAMSMNNDKTVFMQELDGFNGIVIMTTNFFGNYDQAIIRRVAQHVEFKLPNQVMRAQLFKEHCPNMARVQNVDWKTIALASKGFSGGDIFQVMLNAIILASVSPDTSTWWLTDAHLLKEIKKMAEAKDKHRGPRKTTIHDTITDSKKLKPAPSAPPTDEAPPTA